MPEICRQLNISEHEFFTACDDIVARRQQRILKNYGLALRVYQWVMCGVYAIALATCFIVDLAVSHALTWFFIVAASVLTAFTVTNLPLLLKRWRMVFTLAGLTASTFLLLWVIWLYTGGAWLLPSLVVAGISFVWLWATAFVFSRKNWSWLLRGGLVCLLAGALATMNPLCGLLFGDTVSSWWDYISLTQGWNAKTVSSKIVFWALIMAGAGLLTAGAVKKAAAKRTGKA